MPTASAHLAVAASQIGHYGDYNKFNQWYWGSNVGYAWCAAFQSWCAKQSGLPAAYSASAAGFATQFDRVDDSQVKPGDIVIFNWDGRTDTGWADHVGIVEWSTIAANGYFGTIEGNTGNGDVARVTRYNRGSYFTAFYRPPYDAEKPASEPATTKKKVDKVKSVNGKGGTFSCMYKAGGHNGRKCSQYRWMRLKESIAKYLKLGYKKYGKTFTVKPGGTVPVYKLRNAGNGDDMLTTSLSEAKSCEGMGWTYQGVPFMAPKSGLPMYRLYCPTRGEHRFTPDKAERDRKLKTGKWEDEKVAFFVDSVQ